jgi:hypothetical protein
MMNIVAEQPWLWAGLSAYLLATLIAMWGVSPHAFNSPTVSHKTHEKWVLGFMLLAVLLLSAAIAVRWMRYWRLLQKCRRPM